MKQLLGRTAALHVAFWQYDPWYRRAWFVWPQAAAVLLAGSLVADRVPVWSGKWGKPIDCSSASTPGCAATQRVMFSFFDEVAKSTLNNQYSVFVDRTAFRSSAAADQPKLAAALASYYRGEWAKAADTLKSATPADPNVQFVTALVLLTPHTTDQVREAQTLLRTAASAGDRQAGVMLGHVLFVGWGGLPKDEQEGRKLIEEGAAAGNPYGMRLAGVGYVSCEFGSYDPVKAVDLLRKAADAGDPVAMAQFAYSLRTGRGGLTRDDAKALDYLRRAADAGYTDAQYTLARWTMERYENHETENPSEGIKWYERAYQRGYSFFALVNLARAHRFARATPWFDTHRAFELLQLCAPYAFSHCHYWLGSAYQAGAGTPQDLVKAYAHYEVAKQLGLQEASASVAQLESILLPAAKSNAKRLAESISGNLKTVPAAIGLQIPETESAGPSPWAAPGAAVASQGGAQAAASPSQATASAADWNACKGKDEAAAIAACARLIASGISGADLGMAHYLKGWNHYKKEQHAQAIADYDKAIQLRANLSTAYNDRGIAYQALGNFDAALRDFTESVGTEPNALGYENRAYIHLRRNRFDEAIADATTSIRLNPKRARTYWIRSGAYEEKEKGQWTDAVADATTCIGLDPTFSDCLDRRGYGYFKLDKSDLALADYDESLRLQPRLTWTLVARGNLRKDKQLLDLAMSDYSEAIRLDPKNADAYASRGDVYYMKDQYPLAIADATKAIEINPGTSYAFAVRGFSLFDAGRLDEARSDLAAAVQRYPKWVKPRYWYAVTEAKLEEKMYESCPKGGNRRPSANTMVGGLPICMTGLEFGTSLRELAEVIRLNPEASSAYAFRGYLYIKLQQRERAIADLRRAIQIDPGNASARNNLRAIGATP